MPRDHSLMKAAVLHAAADLRVEAVPRPAITAADEVLIRIHACGICPSDLRAYTGVRKPHRDFPYTPGHEWAGEVVALGDEARGFQVGDRVVPSWRVICGRCHYCIRGLPNFCQNLQYGQVRGGFAQYGVAPAESLLEIPANVSYQEACFCEPLACCINGSQHSNIGLGADVAILGAGPIGLLHLQLAKIAGARLIVSDLLPERLEKARELGADALVNAAQGDPGERVKELTAGRGADVVIVAVGTPKAALQALEMAGLGATVNLFAGTYPPATIPLDPNLIHYRQIHLTGSHDYSPLDFQNALRLIELGLIRVTPLLSHEFPLAQVKAAFDIVAGRKGLKVCIRAN